MVVNKASCAALAWLWATMVGSALAQGSMQGSMGGTLTPYAAVPFALDPDVACLASALETGAPATGPSTVILKASAGCLVPWHSHTAQEQLIVVSGSVLAEMTDHPPTLLGPGGFAMMAGRMAHQFTCQGTAPCVMFVLFDGAYDIKWGKAGR
jgi:hypothetical protein